MIELQPGQVMGHHLVHESLRPVKYLLVVDDDFRDIRTEMIPYGPDDQVAFLVDQERALGGLGGLFDGLPQLFQEIEVPLQFLRAAPDSGRPGNQGMIGRHLQTLQRVPQIRAIITRYPAGYPAALRIVRHQDEEAACQADERGQGRALGSAFILVDLDYHFLSFLDHLFDTDAADWRASVIVSKVLPVDFLQ